MLVRAVDGILGTHRLDEAIPLFERSLADLKRILGPNHPYTLIARNILASAYKAAGRPVR